MAPRGEVSQVGQVGQIASYFFSITCPTCPTCPTFFIYIKERRKKRWDVCVCARRVQGVLGKKVGQIGQVGQILARLSEALSNPFFRGWARLVMGTIATLESLRSGVFLSSIPSLSGSQPISLRRSVSAGPLARQGRSGGQRWDSRRMGIGGRPWSA